MQYQIRFGIKGGFIPVNQNQPISLIIVDQPGSRIHRQAGTGYNQQIRILNSRNAVFQGPAIQGLLIQHHVRFHNAAAGTDRYTFRIPDILSAVKFPADGAVVTQNATMKLIDPAAAGFLMEAINILGHHSGKLSFIFPPGQNFVCNVRLKSKRHHLFPVKAEEIFRITQVKTMGNDPFRRIFKLLAVQSVHTSEIRDPGFG
jgi:hypothetical protein